MYFLYMRMLVILPLNKFCNYLTPLVLSLCCFLFTVPTTLLCCIIKFLMPFDDSVETKDMCFNCTGGDLSR